MTSVRPLPFPRARRLAAVCALGLATSGCFELLNPKVSTRAYAIRVAPGANQDSPVPLELVVVYDKRMLAEVEQLSARDWFQRRAQFERDYPNGFRSMRWEFVPGQSIALHPLELSRRGARGALVFADYLSEGDHRLRLDPYKQVIIELRDQDVVVRSPQQEAPPGGQ